MASSGFSYKTTVPQNSLAGPQGHIVNRFLRLSGSDAGTNNANGVYNATNQTGSFFISPPAGEIWRVHRMLVTVLNTSSSTAIDQYAGIATLANGIQIQVVNGVTQDLTNNDPIEFTELKGALKRIEDAIMTMKEKNEEMADDITKIKEAIYNPDQGIYSRLKELEAWKQNMSKVLWIGATGVIGSIGVAIWEVLKNT